MGCYKRTGFYSHLPIREGDEIVVFVLLDESKKYVTDACPISVDSNGLSPIAPPFFGRYDDYGGIQDVIDDANSRLFNEVFGMDVRTFVEIVNDLGGMTATALQEGINRIESGKLVENTYHHETKECFSQLLSIYNKLFGFDNTNLSLIYTMEHKRIYDKMVELGRNDYSENTVEKCFDNTARFINDISALTDKKFSGVNPLKLGITDIPDIMITDLAAYGEFPVDIKLSILGLIKEKRSVNDYLGWTLILGCGHYFSDNDYSLYRNLKGDITAFRDAVVGFAYFLRAMRNTNTLFQVSPYHGQEIVLDTLYPLYEEMFNFVKEMKGVAEKA